MDEIRRLLLVLAVTCAGCALDDGPDVVPCSEALGARAMPGCRLTVGAQPTLDGAYTGFLVASDKPGHYMLGWIDSLGAPTVFSGTLSVDGTVDPAATHGHVGDEQLRFDAPNQISFSSAPGANLAGVDLTTDASALYLDGYLNGSRLAFDVRFVTPYDGGPAPWDSDLDPVAFAPN
jgi:hypothetical protein